MTEHSIKSDATSSTTPKLTLSAREAAEALGIGERTLWAKTNCGEIPHIRIGRRVLYPIHLLHEWIDKKAKEVKR